MVKRRVAILAGVDVLGLARVTNDNTVNIRNGGSTDYPVIRQARPGDASLYSGKFEGSNWLGIVLADETIGYIYANMASLTRK